MAIDHCRPGPTSVSTTHAKCLKHLLSKCHLDPCDVSVPRARVRKCIRVADVPGPTGGEAEVPDMNFVEENGVFYRGFLPIKQVFQVRKAIRDILAACATSAAV